MPFVKIYAPISAFIFVNFLRQMRRCTLSIKEGCIFYFLFTLYLHINLHFGFKGSNDFLIINRNLFYQLANYQFVILLYSAFLLFNVSILNIHELCFEFKNRIDRLYYYNFQIFLSYDSCRTIHSCFVKSACASPNKGTLASVIPSNSALYVTILWSINND